MLTLASEATAKAFLKNNYFVPHTPLLLYWMNIAGKEMNEFLRINAECTRCRSLYPSADIRGREDVAIQGFHLIILFPEMPFVLKKKKRLSVFHAVLS